MMDLQAMAKALRDGEDLDKYMVEDPADKEFYEKLMREMEEEQKRKADWFVAAKELERFVESLPSAQPLKVEPPPFRDIAVGAMLSFALVGGVFVMGFVLKWTNMMSDTFASVFAATVVGVPFVLIYWSVWRVVRWRGSVAAKRRELHGPPLREIIIGDIVGFLLFWGVVIIALRIIVRLVLM